MAIFPATTGLAAACAAEVALSALKTEGTSASLNLFSFQDFNRLIGFEEVWKFERKWAR
jgi:hypothetical protein